MADTNPFANALRPDKGGLPGFVGGMMGVPTTDQAQGGATGSALAAIANLRASGKTTQEAAMEFFKTPAGQDFFTNAGPDGLKNLQSGLASMQPPTPTVSNVPQGGELYTTDQNGKTTKAAANTNFPPIKLGAQDQLYDRQGNKLAENENISGDEPADVRSFKYYTALAKLPREEIQRLAGLKADPTPNDPNSVKNLAIQRLQDNFGLDPRLADALRSDAIKVIPLKNGNGQDTGDVTVYDLSNPAAGAQLIPNGGARANAATPQATPGTSPSTGAAAGVLPPVKPRVSSTEGNPAFATKDSMALGASPVSKALGIATKLSETVSPSLIIDQGAQANDRQTALDTLRSNLQAIGTIGGGMSSNKGLIEGYVHTYLDQGFFSSPHSQVQKLIRLHENATKNIEEESTRAGDKSLPNEVRKQASETVAGWQRVLSSMPTYDTLIKQEDAIRKGTAGAPTVGGAAKTIVEGGARALTEGKKQASDVSKAIPGGVDIDKINDPKELLAIDPRTLDRAGKIKYLRKIDALKRGMSNGPVQP